MRLLPAVSKASSEHPPEGQGGLARHHLSPAGLAHVSAMAELLDRDGAVLWHRQYRPADERHRQVREALSATTPAARALPAWDQSRLAGIAAYSFVWPVADLTRSLYLKELHIAAACRRRGVGKLLIPLAGRGGQRARLQPGPVNRRYQQRQSASVPQDALGRRYCPRRSSTGSRTAAVACRCPADPVPRPALACRTLACKRERPAVPGTEPNQALLSGTGPAQPRRSTAYYAFTCLRIASSVHIGYPRGCPIRAPRSCAPSCRCLRARRCGSGARTFAA